MGEVLNIRDNVESFWNEVRAFYIIYVCVYGQVQVTSLSICVYSMMGGLFMGGFRFPIFCLVGIVLWEKCFQTVFPNLL